MAYLCINILVDVASFSLYGADMYFLSHEGNISVVSLTTLDERINSLLEPSTISEAVQLAVDNPVYVRSFPLLLLRIKEICVSEKMDIEVRT